MFPLEDTQLRFAVLGTLSVEAERRGARSLNMPGLTEDKIERLRTLTAGELRALAAHRALPIRVVVDGKQLAETLSVVTRARREHELEDYFVRHGAPSRLMQRLFTMSRQTTHRRRGELGARLPPGRYRLPDKRARERICIEWHRLAAEPVRDRYYRLHQLFPQFSLSALDATVNERGIAA